MGSLINRMNNTLIPRRETLFHPLEEQFNQFFNDFFSSDPLNSVKGRVNYPKLDAYENNGNWIVEVAVPGLKSEDINVEITENKYLKISGKMSEENQIGDESTNFYCKELKRSSFSRMITLPENLEGDPKAKMENGILKLSWNMMKDPKPETKKIEIK